MDFSGICFARSFAFDLLTLTPFIDGKIIVVSATASPFIFIYAIYIKYIRNNRSNLDGNVVGCDGEVFLIHLMSGIGCCLVAGI